MFRFFMHKRHVAGQNIHNWCECKFTVNLHSPTGIFYSYTEAAMKNNNEKNENEEMLNDIYKNAKMGMDSISKIIPNVQNENFKQTLTGQLSGYQNFVNESTKMLCNMSKTPKDVKATEKLSVEMGIKMNLVTDKSEAHIAQMMINGSGMGISEMKKKIKESQSRGVPQETLKLANEVVSFEEKNITDLKSFL